jgi:prefoldin subunit 5
MRTKVSDRMTSSKQQQYDRGDVIALEAQIAELKQLVAVLQAQLAAMREEKDKWQRRTERISLVSPC